MSYDFSSSNVYTVTIDFKDQSNQIVYTTTIDNTNIKECIERAINEYETRFDTPELSALRIAIKVNGCIVFDNIDYLSLIDQLDKLKNERKYRITFVLSGEKNDEEDFYQIVWESTGIDEADAIKNALSDTGLRLELDKYIQSNYYIYVIVERYENIMGTLTTMPTGINNELTQILQDLNLNIPGFSVEATRLAGLIRYDITVYDKSSTNIMFNASVWSKSPKDALIQLLRNSSDMRKFVNDNVNIVIESKDNTINHEKITGSMLNVMKKLGLKTKKHIDQHTKKHVQRGLTMFRDHNFDFNYRKSKVKVE